VTRSDHLVGRDRGENGWKVKLGGWRATCRDRFLAVVPVRPAALAVRVGRHGGDLL
jgi:hypothetical protein